ncbi:MAG: hypothetical protein FWH04_04230 [Oscillospiraceae bacterium]|nr:hypothetical protein [Oscillospiraceae bacterium]
MVSISLLLFLSNKKVGLLLFQSTATPESVVLAGVDVKNGETQNKIEYCNILPLVVL